MSPVRSRSILAAAILSALAPAAWCDNIELRADEWCPFNCEPGSADPGYMVEIATEALAPFGHSVDYQTLNWARSFYLTERGEIDGVLGFTPEEAEDFVLSVPLGNCDDVAAFRRGEARDITAPSAFEGLRLGAINGYEYYGPVSAYIKAHANDIGVVQYASGEDALVISLRKLIAGRLDMVAEARSVLMWNARRMGIEDKIEITRSREITPIYIGFTPGKATSTLYAAQLAEGVERLKASGRYDEILAKYGLDAERKVE